MARGERNAAMDILQQGYCGQVLKIAVLTLFPEIINHYLKQSVLGIALEKGLFELTVINPRDYCSDKHKKVDATVFGGGAGMLIMPAPYISALEDYQNKISGPTEVIMTAPDGEKFNQTMAEKFSQKNNLIFLCGRYEGFDVRIEKYCTRKISIGDYVLTGGELAALAMIDSSLRLIPGVLGDAESSHEESFSVLNLAEKFQQFKVSKKELQEFLDELNLSSLNDLQGKQMLEPPQYTKPVEFNGDKVPEILLEGNHKKIFLWRLKEAYLKTLRLRPDLLR